MVKLLSALKGAKKIAEGRFSEGLVVHYLLPNGDVLEVITR